MIIKKLFILFILSSILHATEGFSSAAAEEEEFVEGDAPGAGLHSEDIFAKHYDSFFQAALKGNVGRADALKEVYEGAWAENSDSPFNMDQTMYSLLQLTIALNPELNSDITFF